MANLLKTEWLKIKKYPAFCWMTGIVMFTYPGINFIFYKIFMDISQKGGDRIKMMMKMLIGNPFTFPEVWHTVAYASSMFIFIPSIAVIMFITNEYTYKTHRQNIIDGWSRNQFMKAKLIDVLIVSFLATMVFVMVALIIGYINFSEGNGNTGDQTKFIAMFFLQTISQLSIAFFIALLTRKAFLALGIFLFYKIAEKILVGFAAWKANDIGRFLPFEISNRLIPVPAFLGRLDEKGYKRSLELMNQHLILTILLIILTWALCFWINRKRDL